MLTTLPIILTDFSVGIVIGVVMFAAFMSVVFLIIYGRRQIKINGSFIRDGIVLEDGFVLDDGFVLEEGRLTMDRSSFRRTSISGI